MLRAASVLAVMMKADMEKKGLTLKQYADKIGISETALKKILKGTQNVTLTTLDLIAKELGMSQLTLPFDEPSSEEEGKKEQNIRQIQTRLYAEDPQVVSMFKETLEYELSKLKKINSLKHSE